MNNNIINAIVISVFFFVLVYFKVDKKIIAYIIIAPVSGSKKVRIEGIKVNSINMNIFFLFIIDIDSNNINFFFYN